MLFSCNCQGETHLFVCDSLEPSKSVLSKLQAVTENGARAILIDTTGQIDRCQVDVEIVSKPFEFQDLQRYGRLEVDCIVDRVFLELKDGGLKTQIAQQCRRLRIPINVTNDSELSTFALPSTYTRKNLQIAVSTNHQGCKLANRIRRELVQALPEDIEQVVANIGQLRRQIADGDTKRRSKWLSQIIEYYPLSQLGKISIDDLSESFHRCEEAGHDDSTSHGEISLVGSGPGALSMLTMGALDAIYSADIVLSDKLVPQTVIDAIPKTTELFIARKFPGNAAKAQQELMQLGLDSLQAGKKVVRLKQGDPYIFGRGGEEYTFFSDHGYTPTVVPGLTSALVAPLVARIPTTQRDISDQVLICTGTAKNGKVPKNLPQFDEKRTVVFLMSIKKIVELLPALQEKQWPGSLPVCIVERASCPDQRVVRTHLKDLPEVLASIESRPPGLIVTGYSCEYLAGPTQGLYKIEESQYGGHLEQSVTKIVQTLSRGASKSI